MSEQVRVHFYRAVVGHMDVWRQRMDATTNWAAATSAAMITFALGSSAAPHETLLLSLALQFVFLLMESRRYQVFDLWRRRFRLLNRAFIAPALDGSAGHPDLQPERDTALAALAEDLGALTPKLALGHAVGYRIRRNYGYLFLVTGAAWLFKLELHPDDAGGWGEMVGRAAVGEVPGAVVMLGAALAALAAALLALAAPSEQMVKWAEVETPLARLRWWRRNA